MYQATMALRFLGKIVRVFSSIKSLPQKRSRGSGTPQRQGAGYVGFFLHGKKS